MKKNPISNFLLQLPHSALSQGQHEVASFDTWKSDMMGNAKMEDARVIWECLSEQFSLNLVEGEEGFRKERGEDGWLALEKCLSLTDDEWWFLVASSSDDEDGTQQQWLVEMRKTQGKMIGKAGDRCGNI